MSVIYKVFTLYLLPVSSVDPHRMLTPKLEASGRPCFFVGDVGSWCRHRRNLGCLSKLVSFFLLRWARQAPTPRHASASHQAPTSQRDHQAPTPQPVHLAPTPQPVHLAPTPLSVRRASTPQPTCPVPMPQPARQAHPGGTPGGASGGRVMSGLLPLSPSGIHVKMLFVSCFKSVVY
jgi:hypothetical protein